VPEIFMHSSNIGSVRMVMAVGSEAQKDFMGRIGLLQKPQIELPEVGAPLVPKPWRDINSWTISFGHGLSVSPLMLAQSAAATINGGIFRPATLLYRDPGAPDVGKRVLSERTSEQMRRMFRLVVTDGTASGAAAPGYIVGGKTGTAEKIVAGGYNKKARLSSFVGAFPMTNPKYLVIAVVDEPKGTKKSYGFATGGWVGAPVVGRIIRRMGPLLGIMPQDEFSPDVLTTLAIPGVSKSH
jgi:cell division protein FtsI (penicillin-binding protein 3)